jgi:hypothetical protein
MNSVPALLQCSMQNPATSTSEQYSVRCSVFVRATVISVCSLVRWLVFCSVRRVLRFAFWCSGRRAGKFYELQSAIGQGKIFFARD